MKPDNTFEREEETSRTPLGLRSWGEAGISVTMGKACVHPYSGYHISLSDQWLTMGSAAGRRRNIPSIDV